MHDYSLDTPVRRYVHYGLALAAFTIPHAFTALTGYAIPGNQFGYPISVGTTFTLLYLIFDHWAWKKLHWILKIPNLAGDWHANGISSYPDPETGEPYKFNMHYTIKQTFSRIEVYGETDTSTSRSTPRSSMVTTGISGSVTADSACRTSSAVTVVVTTGRQGGSGAGAAARPGDGPAARCADPFDRPSAARWCRAR